MLDLFAKLGSALIDPVRLAAQNSKRVNRLVILVYYYY